MSTETFKRRGIGESVDRTDRIIFFVRIAVGLCVVYVGLKYPVPWLWRRMGIFSILIIPFWLVALGVGAFCLGVAVPILAAAVVEVAASIVGVLWRLAIDVLLFIPVVMTNSTGLYAVISPHLAVRLLARSSSKKRMRVLRKLHPNELSRMLVWEKGIWLLSRLLADERSIVLQRLETREIHEMLTIIGVKRYPEFAWLLRHISHDKLEGHLFYESFTHRAAEAKILSELGIHVNVGKDGKPYHSLEA